MFKTFPKQNLSITRVSSAFMQSALNPKSPKSKKSPAFFGFWAQNFFGGLNQKSATISMCKIHIYIDSESFRQIR